MTARSLLYRLARAMGDAQAASRGPASYGRRVVRKSAYRTSARVTRRVLRGFGL